MAERLFAVTTADVFSLRLTATRRFTAMKSLPKIPTEPAVRLARKTSTRKRLRTIRLSRPTTRRGTNISDADYDKILHYLETMRDKAIRGKSDENGNLITYKTLEELFEKHTLYKTLNIGEEQ